MNNKWEGLDIRVVANGYMVIDPYYPSSNIQKFNTTFVFGTLEELFNWIKENLNHPSSSSTPNDHG